MCDLMYASSPSWYCSKTVDADQRGFLYFAANYNLYVLNVTSTPPKYVLHLHAHQQRAVGVSVCNLPGQWSCCTIGEDGKVKIWDLESKICQEEHSSHKNPLTCVHWSPLDRDLIATSDSKGGIVVWHINRSEFTIFTPEVSHVFALTWSPHKRELLAIGYKSSSILIVNVNRGGQVVQRLRGHDEEIHGLCWCPKPGEELQWRSQAEEDKDEGTVGSLLASSSKDRTIRVWATSTGRSLVTMKLPPTSGGRKDKAEDRVGGRVWVGLNWPANKPMQLVSSSFNGEMLLWDLGKTGKQKYQTFSASKHARGHGRLVFNVVTAGPDLNIVCTSSMDRHIILWDMTSLKAKLSIPTLGGFGYCLALSPVNPGRLAVGSGDCLIRMWNIDNSLNPFDTQVFWQGLKSKVTALCWHPVKEGQLAYGTEDGRVGIYEVFSSRSPQISSTYHRGTVYNVTWGPPCVQHENYPSNTYFLFSCGDGRLLQHEPSHLDKEALDINKCIREVNQIKGKYPGHTEISFKPDYQVVAVGNDDGSIDILNVPDLTKLCFIQVHRKLVNVIKWHPEYTADSREISPYNAWLATGSGESIVHVLDLTNILGGGHIEETPVVITESKCQLVGHSNRITQLSWSTFTQGMLASASYDHTVQIWDVKTCKPIANYRGHFGRLMCVQWSDLDPDVVYSGGQDNTVQCWNISKQQFTTPPVGSADKGKKNKKKKKDVIGNQPAVLEPTATTSAAQESIEEMQQLLEQKKQELMASAVKDSNKSDSLSVDRNKSESLFSSNMESADSEELHMAKALDSCSRVELAKLRQNVAEVLGEELACEEVEEETTESESVPSPDLIITKKDGKDKKKKKYRSLLPKSSLKDNRGKGFQHEDCVELANYIYKECSNSLGEELFHIGHFIDRRTTFELMKFEAEYHKAQGNQDQVAMLEIMKGNLGGMLRQAANEGHLSDWMVGLSPMGSSPFWKELCEVYAKQLERDGFFHKAMSYLLASNKISEAIDVLCRSGAYKDAVCLARIRLSPHDPKLKHVYTRWAEVLAKDANLEMAAKCYISCGEPLEAAKCLARRTDLTALKAAAQICVISDQLEAAKLYTHRLIQDCYVCYDWKSAQEVIRSHHSFHHYALPMSCHELLVSELTKMKLLSSDVTSAASPSDGEFVNPSADKLPINTADEDSLCPWPLWLVNGEVFSLAVVRLWVEKWGIILETQQLTTLYCTLKNMKTEKHGMMQLSQILVSVTFDLVLGLLQLLLGEGDLAADHWALAISTCLDQDEIAIGQGICRLMLPQGVGNFKKLAQQIYALKITTTGTAVPERKTSVTLRNLSPKKTLNTSSDSSLVINCDKDNCTALDSLKAFYSISVLKHWLSATEGSVNTSGKSGKKSSSKENLNSPGNRSIQSNSPRSPVKIGASTPKKGKDAIVGKNLSSEFTQGAKRDDNNGSRLMSVLSLPSRCLSLSETALCEVSQNLLWDVHAKKQKLEDSLTYIQSAISDMISKHKDNRSVQSGSNTLHDRTSSFGSLNEMLSPMKVPIKRAPSGEYIAMNKHENKGNITPKKRLHEKIAITPIKGAPILSVMKSPTAVNDDDEFVDMKEERSECTTQCEVKDNVFIGSDNQTDHEKSLNIDINEGTGTAIFSLGSPDIKSKRSASGSVEDPNGSLSDEAKQMPLSVKSLVYANVPDDWFEMSVDTKYKCDFVTLQLLTTEQQNIQQQIQELQKTIQNNVFPAVLTCARDITCLLVEQNELVECNTDTLGNQLLKWIDKYKYLSQHMETINNLKLALIKSTST